MGTKEKIKLIYLVVLLLNITGCAFFESKTHKYIAYKIAPGDTVYEISERFGSNTKTIKKLNRIRDLKKLQIGTTVKIPYKGQVPLKKTKKIETNIYRSKKTGFVWPLEIKGRITSRFGWRKRKFHEGLDIGAVRGTHILAAHDAKVVYSGNKFGGYGNIIILSDNNYLTVYAHNKKNIVKKGIFVKAGQKIAEVGSTGHATGSHLHFEVRKKEPSGGFRAYNPLIFYTK